MIPMQPANSPDAEPVEKPPDRLAELRDFVVVTLAIGLFFFTLAGIVSPQVPLAIENVELDQAINGLATGIAAMAALLQWNRYRQDEEPGSLLQATALLVLASANGAILLIGILGLKDSLGLSLGSPDQAPIYGWLVTRFLAAALFAFAALADLRGWRWTFDAVPFAVGGAVIAAVAFPLFALFESHLPVLYDVAELPQLVSPEPKTGVAPGSTVAIIVANLLVAAILLVAARLHREVGQVTGRRQAALLSVALLIGALSQVQFAIVPPSYSGLVSAGDVLRVAFYAYLVLVFNADTMSTLHDLRAARGRMEELARTRLTQAIIDERSRLARDIHDGLAQELWLAKLRLGRLLKVVGGAPGDLEQESGALRAAIDNAIAEARLAVIAMNVQPGQRHNLETALARYVHDLTERLDIIVTFRVEPPIPALSVHASEQILRTVHEALNNVRKHSEASMAAVVLDAPDGLVRISIEDNGRGLRPEEHSSGYGLKTMRERVEALGGRLRIESRGLGTRVVVEVPAGVRSGRGPRSDGNEPPESDGDAVDEAERAEANEADESDAAGAQREARVGPGSDEQPERVERPA